jgi:hypothetical protein
MISLNIPTALNLIGSLIISVGGTTAIVAALAK